MKNSWPLEDISPPPLPPRGKLKIWKALNPQFVIVYLFSAPERRTSDAPPLPRRLPSRRASYFFIFILMQNAHIYCHYIFLQDSEMTDIDMPVLRDSGYSESLHSASYEEFVLPSIDKDKIIPPPLPPKHTQSQLNSELNGINYIIYERPYFIFIFLYFVCIYICFKCNHLFLRTTKFRQLFCARNDAPLGIQSLVKYKTFILELVPFYA